MATVSKLIVALTARTTSFERAMKRAERTIDRTGRRFKDVGSKLTTGLTLPIVAMGGVAIKAAIDFETAFTGVIKTVDGTTTQIAALRSGIKQMAAELPATTTEIAGVAEAAGQLGISTENILGFTRVMIDLGETTNLSATEAATALARLANITQLPQDKFENLGSAIVALGNNMATTEAEIVTMGLRLAGAGKQVGISEGKILGLAAALSSVGVEAQAGGTAFSKVMIEIASAVAGGGDALEKFADVAGISSTEFAKRFKVDAASAIVDFVEGLGRMEERGKSVFAVIDDLGLSEIRLRDALLRASGAGDLFRKALRIGSDAFQKNTALAKEAALRYKTVSAQLSVMKNKAMGVALIFGEAMIPALLGAMEAAQPLLETLTGMAKAFADLEPGTKNLVLGIAAVAAAIGPALIVIGTLISAFSTVAAAASGMASTVVAVLGPAGTVVTALEALAVFAGASMGAIVVALALVPAALFLWITRWEEIRDGSVAIWEFLKESGARIFSDLARSMGEIVTGMVSMIRTQLIDRIAEIVEPVRETTEKIIEIFRSMSQILVGGSIVPDMVSDIGDKFHELEPKMVVPITKGAKKMKAAFAGLKIAAASNIGAFAAEMVKGKKSVGEFVQFAIRQLARLAIKMAALQIGGPLGALVGGFAGGFFARGGRPQPNMPSLVGERGPELFIPDRAGRVQPLSQALTPAGAGGGGGMTVMIPITVQASPGTDGRRVGKDIVEALNEALRRPDGLTSKLATKMKDLADKESRRSG